MGRGFLIEKSSAINVLSVGVESIGDGGGDAVLLRDKAGG